MSDQAAVSPISSGPAQHQPSRGNITIVEGVIDEIRDFNGLFETRVILPSADRYSKPGAVLVKSKKRIGGKGEEIRIPCRLTGAPRFFFLNRGTRQEERIETADSWCEPLNE